MKVVSCEPGQMSVSPEQFNACTFNIIDKWDPKQHAKTCDTMFYLRDGTGAYVWDCDKWIFLDFTGYTAPDWNASENQQGYIKNKPFQTLGNGLIVSKEGVLSVNVTPEDIGAASTEELNEHINDTKNPHKVTAGQTGAYTKVESDANVINQLSGADSARVKKDFLVNGIEGTGGRDDNGATVPFSQKDYEDLLSDDGVVRAETLIPGRGAEEVAVFNVIEILENRYPDLFKGFKTMAEKIAFYKTIVKSFATPFVARGGGVHPTTGSPSNYSNIYLKTSSGGWAGVSSGSTTNNTDSFREFSGDTWSTASANNLQADGTYEFRICSRNNQAKNGNAQSDGVTPAWVEVKKLKLVVELELNGREIILSTIAHYHRENPPEWTEVTEKPFETIGDNLEVEDGKLNASNVTVADQEEVNSGTVPDKYISPKTLAEWEKEQLLKRGKQIVLGSNRQLESPSDMNFGKFGISDNSKAGTFKNEQPYFSVDEAGDVIVKKAGQYIISGVLKKQYRRAVSIWHYISFVHKDITSGSEVKLDTFPYGGTTQNRNKQYGYEVRQCKVGDKIWAHSDSSAAPGNANADALQYLNMEYFCMERLGD